MLRWRYYGFISFGLHVGFKINPGAPVTRSEPEISKKMEADRSYESRPTKAMHCNIPLVSAKLHEPVLTSFKGGKQRWGRSHEWISGKNKRLCFGPGLHSIDWCAECSKEQRDYRQQPLKSSLSKGENTTVFFIKGIALTFTVIQYNQCKFHKSWAPHWSKKEQ